MAIRRPRLSEHIAVRRHIVDGRPRVLLHLIDEDKTAMVGPREWDLVRAADGTRDAAGLAAAAQRHKRRIAPDEAEAFMAGMEAAGMLEDGIAAAPETTTLAPAASEATPLLVLTGLRLRCDGQGSCCRLYPTTLFSAREASRARAFAADVLDAGDDESRAFTPARGSTLAAWQPRAVAMVNGRCAYLQADLGCSVHAAGGEAAKPAGCRQFPLTFVSDGSRVRVSLAPECSCVFRSAAASSPGDRVLPSELLSSRQLPAAAWIAPAPQRIAITKQRYWSRQQYATLRASLLELATRSEVDLAQLLWHLGGILASREGRRDEAAANLDEAVRDAQDSAFERLFARPRAVDAQSVQIALGPLQKQLERRVEQDAWRAADDLAGQGFTRLLAASRQLGASLPSATDHAAEQLYLRLSAFGDLWLRPAEPPLGAALRQRALRLWLARALAGLGTEKGLDPAWQQPLALVEALVRGYGLQQAPFSADP